MALIPAKRHKRLTVIERKRAFLAAFRISGSITDAAKAAKLDRALHYRWLLEDLDYPARFAAVQRDVAESYHKRSVEEAEWQHSSRKARILLEMHRNHEDRIAKLEAELRRLKTALKR